MWTINNRKLIRGAKEHIAAGLGAGADYVANYEEIASPIDGIVEKIYTGNEGGNWLWIKDAKGRSWQFAHLSNRSCIKNDQIKQGQIIAKSGNTGTITTNPHLHIQVIDKNGERLDPEIIIKELLKNPMAEKFNRIKEKFINKYNSPKTVPYMTKKDGKPIRCLVKQNDDGTYTEKQDISVDEIIGSLLPWD